LGLNQERNIKKPRFKPTRQVCVGNFVKTNPKRNEERMGLKDKA